MDSMINFTPIPGAMNGLVGWDPGAPNDGLGGFDPSQGEELRKAMTGGSAFHPTGAMTSGDAGGLRPENLDPVLYNLSFRMEHIRAWPMLYKDAVGNTVNEHNVLISHGSGVAFFHNEGDLPQEDDSNWERRITRTACMGTTRRTTILAQVLNLAHMKAEAHQIAGGTLWMLQQLERMLFEGNRALSSVQFDGIFTLLLANAPATNVIDMRGQPLTGDYVNYGTGIVKGRPNYGLATDIFMPLEVFTDLADDVAPNARYAVPPEGYKQGIAGVPVKGWHSQNGMIRFQDDVFLYMGEAPSAVAIGDAAKRPGAPTISVAPAAGAPSAGVTSYFTASWAGGYRYQVVAANRYGYSTPVTVSAGAVSPAVDQTVKFTIADGSPLAEYYILYRSEKDGAASTNKEITRIARSGAATVYEDNNYWLPGTGKAILLQNNREYWKWNRLLKFMKLPLARLDTSDRFMLLLFGNLVNQTPAKGLLYINVGRVSRSFAT